MDKDKLSDDDKKILLDLARKSIQRILSSMPPIEFVKSKYSSILKENGASFVTLTKHGNLRGCIGALEPYQPLVQDVCEHAVAAAFSDYRFPPVQADEFFEILIEISRLTLPRIVDYKVPEDLLNLLKPNVDGVILQNGFNRATFLPQVWNKIPRTEEFLTQLCQKMGENGNLWKIKMLKVSIYQVEEFHE